MKNNGETIDVKLVVFDMDGVLTGNPSSWNYVHDRLGVENSVNLNLFMEDKISYEDFLKSDVELWIKKLGVVSKSYIISLLNDIAIRENLLNMVGSIRKLGAKVAIVSGGISWLADRINSITKFDYSFSNKILTDSNGNIIPEGLVEVDPKKKDINVRYLQDILGIEKDQTVSVGDSSSDISMFVSSGYSICFNPIEEGISRYTNNTISSNDLNSILYEINSII